MPTDVKIYLGFTVIGLINYFLRDNRNWIFSYRSARALFSHKSFACANGMFSIGLIVYGAFFSIVYFFIQDFYVSLTDSHKWIIAAAYFVPLIILTELRLRKLFPNE